MRALLEKIKKKPAGALALSVAAILLGLIIPPLPLLRRGATRATLLATAAWLILFIVFFFVAFGPALLGHLGLWFATSLAMLFPKRLQQLEAAIPHLGALA